MVDARVVGERDFGITFAAERRDGITGRGREPTAEHVYPDNEVSTRIEDFVWSDVGLHVGVGTAVPARFNDHIRFVRCELPVSFVSDFGIAQNNAGLELGRFDIEDLIIDWLRSLRLCGRNWSKVDFDKSPGSTQNGSSP
jgi:hypothetical protein